MKKLITCITAASILMAGTGCGDTEDGAQGGEAYGLQGNRVGTGSGGAGHGQDQRGLAGTRDRYGAAGQQEQGQLGERGHQGQGRQGEQYNITEGQTARNGGFSRGIVGDDRPGMVDDNGLLNGRMRANDQTNDYRGLNQGTGRRNYGGTGGVTGRTGAGGASPYGADGPATSGGAGGMTGGAAGGSTGGVGAGGVDGAGGAGADGMDAGRAGRNGTGAGGAIANRRPNNQSYYATEEGRTARQIEERVDQIDGVQDADVIISDDEVVVGIRGTNTNGNNGNNGNKGNNGNNGNNGNTESQVRSAVSDMVEDKQIHVVTDEAGAQEIHQMEGRLRGGEAFEEVGETFNAMLDDLGDAIQRPFEQTR
ncbi:YhcN/YlaJ family sporulation lipoprotein [Salipaludibacillus sp. CF4.18]|uniref:YhcN/YlaJ family sporulation lipoprotein n=1 Tax=Salipaludibacillus sp. CF4.18 TaxID=3373081 RepID=UPI003EE44CB5